MKRRTTNRGFALIEFTDRNGERCSLQQSSLAFESAIWLGVDDAKPQTFVPNGRPAWRPLDLPAPAPGGHHLFTTRMHLTQDQVRELLPVLQFFAHHGHLPSKDQG